MTFFCAFFRPVLLALAGLILSLSAGPSLASSILPPLLNAAISSQVVGCDGQVHLIETSGAPRLLQIVQAVPTAACGYFAGSRLEVASLRGVQAQHKQQLMHALERLADFAQQEQKGAHYQDYFNKLSARIAAQEVHGRLLLTLHPYDVEVMPRQNPFLTESTRLVWVQRPNTFEVIGGLSDREFYEPFTTIQTWARRVPACDACEKAWAWLVQPSGEVRKVKLGAWALKEQVLAPGGYWVRPLDPNWVQARVPDFYPLLLEWLSWQGH